MINREEAEALAAVIQSVDPDDAVNSYFARLAERIKQDGVHLPRVTIEWRNLTCVVEATTSQGSLPSLPNVLLLIAKVWIDGVTGGCEPVDRVLRACSRAMLDQTMRAEIDISTPEDRASDNT